jgi:hypothetical protein
MTKKQNTNKKTNLSEEPLNILMDKIEQENPLLDELLQEDKEIDYPKFYAKLENQVKLIEEIFSKPLAMRINYYDLLQAKIKAAILEENYLDAAKIKKRADYFWHGFLDRMPKKYLPK